uniref:Uncharacterized protein n=1 Tax=Anguilla anguilla TaxID=7936 RepID=A0A0E9XHS6_ANGAN
MQAFARQAKPITTYEGLCGNYIQTLQSLLRKQKHVQKNTQSPAVDWLCVHCLVVDTLNSLICVCEFVLKHVPS